MAGITFPKELEVTSVQYASLYKNGLEVENATYYKNDNNQTEDLLEFESKIDELEMIDVFKIEVSCKHFVHKDNARYLSVRDIRLAGNCDIL